MTRPARMPPNASSQTSEDRFDDLVEEVTQRLEAGESVDPNQFLAFGPELVERLRRLLPTLQAMAALHSASRSGSQPGRKAHSSSASVAKDLGDFQLGDELGRGGMGIVFTAEQKSLARRVAVKVLPCAGLLSEVALERFRTEARAAASLAHEHIVPVYAVGCERGIHFYAMKFVDGCTLADVIAEFKVSSSELRVSSSKAEDTDSSSTRNSKLATRNLPADTQTNAALVTRAIQKESDWYRSIARLGLQAARALAHAHAQGIVHRDVKPSNLLIDKTGRLWLSDFGLARLEADAGLTRTGDLLGTLRYMSPEQALGQSSELDARADIYSLGATLYECLTLKPAIPAASHSEILRQAADPRIASLRSHDPNIPESLERIILKCLRPEPADRYPSADELVDDLERFLRGDKVHAALPTPYEQTRRWVTRHPTTMLAAVAALTTVSLCLSLLALYLGTSERPGRDPPSADRHAPQVAPEPIPLDSFTSSESPAMPRSVPSIPSSQNRRSTTRPLFLESLEGRCLMAQLAFGTPTNMGSSVNSTGVDEAPTITADGLSLFFARQSAPYYSAIFEATRATIEVPFGNATSAGPEVNFDIATGHPAVSQDGLTLIYSVGSGPIRLYQATRTSRNEPFGAAQSLGDLVGNQDLTAPSLSANGKTLYFTAFDATYTPRIYQATRNNVGDSWGNVVMLGPEINSGGAGSPSISTDELTLYFTSGGLGGFGNRDLFVSSRAALDAPWGAALNLGPQVNTAYDERAASVSADGKVLYFHSNRPGGFGSDDLYEVAILGPATDTKFYVVDDAATDRTFEYQADGIATDGYQLALDNIQPRGAASTASGDKVWVVDANKKVYVYDNAGTLLGSWAAGGLSQPEGIATNGTDIWIVDASADKVYKFAGAASRLSGTANSPNNASFKLNSGNKDAKDIVTDGASLWIVNDSSTDKVFKYNLSGQMQGNWTISGGGSSPTGITLDPSSPNHLWIVDNATDSVYQYDGATARTSGSQGASGSFALVSGTNGNLNPQGIADPPVGEPTVLASATMVPRPTFDAGLALANLRPAREATLRPERKLPQPVGSTNPVVLIQNLDIDRPQVVDEALTDYLREERNAEGENQPLGASPRFLRPNRTPALGG